MCGLGVPVGCRMKHGKRQAWTPTGLDAHKKALMCGLGVPVGCRMKHGKRQAWTPMPGCKGRPKEAIDEWPWGACWM